MPFQSFSIFWRFHLRITYVGPTGKNKSVMAYISIILNLNSWFSIIIFNLSFMGFLMKENTIVKPINEALYLLGLFIIISLIIEV